MEMVHGHTLHALLSSTQKSQWFFIFWDKYIRCLTAPTFLFASGIAFAFSTLERQDYLYISKKFLNRIRKLFFLIILGYSLHLPFFSLRKTISYIHTPVFEKFLNIDILQCIGITLFILQIVYLITKEIKKFFISLAFLSILTLHFNNILSKNQNFLNTIPLFFQSFFSKKISFFPLIPFSFYLFAGVPFGFFFLKFSKNNQKENLKKLFIMYPFVSLLIFAIFKILKIEISHIFIKVAVITIIAELLHFFENVENKILNLFVILGKESLVVYYWHLILIYGSAFFDFSLRKYLQGKLSWTAIYGIIITLWILFLTISYIWNYLKIYKPKISFIIKWSIYTYFTLGFILRPY